MGAGGVSNTALPIHLPLEGRKTAPQGREGDVGRRPGGEVGGVVIWASGPKPGVGAAGESVLEGLRGPQAGWGRGGRVEGMWGRRGRVMGFVR